MDLVFATANLHKLEEVAAILPPHLNLIPMKKAGITEDIPETGTDISENAAIKARHVYTVLKSRGWEGLVISDDSGLEVNALGGQPGVYSARYAGEEKNDAKNNAKLLDELKTVTRREARFVTVIALINKDQIFSFEGEVKGTIAYEGRGTSGFGYDPLFIPQGYRSTFAELGAEVKNKISHRARAIQELLVFLQKMPGV